jgi:hypothetical protein
MTAIYTLCQYINGSALRYTEDMDPTKIIKNITDPTVVLDFKCAYQRLSVEPIILFTRNTIDLFPGERDARLAAGDAAPLLETGDG